MNNKSHLYWHSKGCGSSVSGAGTRTQFVFRTLKHGSLVVCPRLGQGGQDGRRGREGGASGPSAGVPNVRRRRSVGRAPACRGTANRCPEAGRGPGPSSRPQTLVKQRRPFQKAPAERKGGGVTAEATETAQRRQGGAASAPGPAAAPSGLRVFPGRLRTEFWAWRGPAPGKSCPAAAPRCAGLGLLPG